MEDKYYHSVRLEKEKCMGCTNCIKRCPTEAIRVHDGKATIMKSRCIDCGECIRACPHSAKRAVTDDFEMIKQSGAACAGFIQPVQDCQIEKPLFNRSEETRF